MMEWLSKLCFKICHILELQKPTALFSPNECPGLFQWLTPLWKIIKYAKHFAKNEEKPCSSFLKPIYPRPALQKPKNRVPDSSLGLSETYVRRTCDIFSWQLMSEFVLNEISRKTLQNLPYMKTQSSFFHFSCCANLFFSYVDIDQSIH